VRKVREVPAWGERKFVGLGLSDWNLEGLTMSRFKSATLMLLPPILGLLSNILVTTFVYPYPIAQFIIPSVALYVVFGLMILSLVKVWKWERSDLGFKRKNLRKNIGIGVLGGLATISIGFVIWGLAFACVDVFELQGLTRYLMVGLEAGSSPALPLVTMLTIVLVVWCVMPAFIEETYFRGLVIRKLQDFKLSGRTVLITQALIFGFWHWHWGVVRGFLFTFIMALILAKLYFRQKSIATPIVVHLTNNIIGNTIWVLGI